MPDENRTGSEAEMLAAKRTAELDGTAIARLAALERHKESSLKWMADIETWRATVPANLAQRLESIERGMALRDGGDGGDDRPPLRLGGGGMSH